MMKDLSDPDVEGIYETQISLETRAILTLGCVCAVDRKAYPYLRDGTEYFQLEQLVFKSTSYQPYLREVGPGYFQILLESIFSIVYNNLKNTCIYEQYEYIFRFFIEF